MTVTICKYIVDLWQRQKLSGNLKNLDHIRTLVPIRTGSNITRETAMLIVAFTERQCDKSSLPVTPSDGSVEWDNSTEVGAVANYSCPNNHVFEVRQRDKTSLR